MKRLFPGIRPPGAPTSIRPPTSTSIRPPKQGSYTSPPRPGRVRRSDRSRTPGQRRPRASRTSRASRTPRTPRGSRGSGVAVVVLVLIVAVLVAALPDLVEDLSRPRVAVGPTFPARTIAARRTPSPSPTPSDRPAYAGSWQEAWSLDDPVLVGTSTSRREALLYAWGDYFVVAHRLGSGSDSRASVTGYRLGAADPERAWTITMDGFTEHPKESTPWGSKLIMGGKLVDVATGEASDAPWERASPRLVFNNLAIVCASSGDWCAGWDWNDGDPVERWRRGSMERNWYFPTARVVGDDATGHVRIEERPRSRRSGSSTSGPSASGFLSLADGSIHNSSNSSSSKTDQTTYIPAADGWLRRSKNASGFEMLSPDGTPAGAVKPATTDDEYLVLLSPTGPPTLDEYRRAYELGDTGWATTALTSSRDGRSRPQLLNGRPLANRTPSTPRVPTVFEDNRALLSPDGRTLLVTRSSPDIPVVAVDLTTSTATDLPPEVTDGDHVRVTIRADLIIAVVGTRIVGYAPTG